MTQLDTMMMTYFSDRVVTNHEETKCPYCYNTGWEIKPVRLVDLYGPDSVPVDYAVPCRICDGKKKTYKEENKRRLVLPYDAFLGAFNPSAYGEESPRFRKKYEFVVRFVENFKKIQKESDIKGLYIYSRMGGNGKTFLASIVCNELFSRYHIMPLYVTENTLLEELNKAVAQTEYSPREKYRKAQVLFIDDMWRKKTQQEWVVDELFGIIDYRYTHGLCTIVTSNLGLDAQYLDKRITGRLNEMCALIDMPEIDIRAGKKEESKSKLNDIINGSTKEEPKEKQKEPQDEQLSFESVEDDELSGLFGND